jgi:hypothetical protein
MANPVSVAFLGAVLAVGPHVCCQSSQQLAPTGQSASAASGGMEARKPRTKEVLQALDAFQMRALWPDTAQAEAFLRRASSTIVVDSTPASARPAERTPKDAPAAAILSGVRAAMLERSVRHRGDSRALASSYALLPQEDSIDGFAQRVALDVDASSQVRAEVAIRVKGAIERLVKATTAETDTHVHVEVLAARLHAFCDPDLWETDERRLAYLADVEAWNLRASAREGGVSADAGSSGDSYASLGKRSSLVAPVDAALQDSLDGYVLWKRNAAAQDYVLWRVTTCTVYFKSNVLPEEARLKGHPETQRLGR